MNREEIQKESVSLKLYQFLYNKVVGSEDTVRYRRLYYTVQDDIHSVDKYKYISSGSKAEGLHLRGSDTDLMFCDETHIVYDSNNNDLFTTSTFLRMDSGQSLPGFVHIVVPPFLRDLQPFTINTPYGLLLSNRKFKNHYQTKLNKDFKNFHESYNLHGPCVSNSDESRDFAFCLRCCSWPHIARNWVSRNRSSSWPAEELIVDICEHGILLVPIGSKSTGDDNPFEWRISFSQPEKSLIYSFNHTQFLCYALLKIVLKHIINKQAGEKNFLCSYFLKTAMFWVSEDIQITDWRPYNLLNCFWKCLQRLLYWIHINYIPNYFIPEHNMIDGKIKEDDRMITISVIEHLINSGWKSLSICESLQAFNFKNFLRVRVSDNKVQEYEDTIFRIVNSGCISIGYNPKLEMANILEEELLKCLRRVHEKYRLSKKTKNLYAYYYAENNIDSVLIYDSLYMAELPFCGRSQNILFYKYHKRIVSNLLIGTHCNACYGWILLSVLFFCSKQYQEAIKILDYTLVVFSAQPCQTKVSCCGRNSFFQRLRTEIVVPIVRLNFYTKSSDFFYDKDLLLFPGGDYIEGLPEVITHYLRFLCYYRLRDYSKCMKRLQELIQTVQLTENEDKSSDLYLKKAIQMVRRLDVSP